MRDSLCRWSRETSASFPTVEAHVFAKRRSRRSRAGRSPNPTRLLFFFFLLLLLGRRQGQDEEEQEGRQIIAIVWAN